MPTPLLFDVNPDPPARSSQPRSFRLLVMGYPQCGKTSLIMSWMKGRFEPVPYGAFPNDMYSSRIKYPYTLPLWTSNGTEENQSPSPLSNSEICELPHISDCDNNVRDTYIDISIMDVTDQDVSEYYYFSEFKRRQVSQADAVVVCFDPTDRAAFDDMRFYLQFLREATHFSIPIVVCCTKVDLVSEEKIYIEEIEEMLSRFDLSVQEDYFEVSTKWNLNTRCLFYTLLKKVDDNKFNIRQATRDSAWHTPRV